MLGLAAEATGLAAEATDEPDTEVREPPFTEATGDFLVTSTGSASISPARIDPNDNAAGPKTGGGGGYTPALVAARVWWFLLSIAKFFGNEKSSAKR